MSWMNVRDMFARMLANGRLIGLLTLVCLFLAPAGFGQAGLGQIQGTVKDSSGGVIPGAAVGLVKQLPCGIRDRHRRSDQRADPVGKQ